MKTPSAARPARVQQKLAIALGAGDRRIDHARHPPAKRTHAVIDPVHGQFMRLGVAHNASLAHVLAPGLKRFGEDATIDRLIRRYGYRGTEATLAAVGKDAELATNLSAAAHLIHGSSEGRFSITYCAPGLGREAVEGAGFRYADLGEVEAAWKPETLVPGFNRIGGEELFWVPNPALGLWATKARFGAST